MLTQHNTLIQKKLQTLTRRSLLAQLLTLGALAALPAGCRLPEAPPDSFAIELIPPHRVLYTPGAGPAERTEAIRRWYMRFDSLIELGEKMQAFLEDAHDKAPADVDGLELLRLEWATLDRLTDLAGEMEAGTFDDDYQLITGWRSYLWCLKQDILSGKGLDPARIQLEIEAIRADDPAAAALLQDLLDHHYGAGVSR